MNLKKQRIKLKEFKEFLPQILSLAARIVILVLTESIINFKNIFKFINFVKIT
jgi:hypothetical protein